MADSYKRGGSGPFAPQIRRDPRDRNPMTVVGPRGNPARGAREVGTERLSVPESGFVYGLPFDLPGTGDYFDYYYFDRDVVFPTNDGIVGDPTLLDYELDFDLE